MANDGSPVTKYDIRINLGKQLSEDEKAGMEKALREGLKATLTSKGMPRSAISITNGDERKANITLD